MFREYSKSNNNNYFCKLLCGHSQRTNLSNEYIKLLASGFIQPHNFPEFIKFDQTKSIYWGRKFVV